MPIFLPTFYVSGSPPTGKTGLTVTVDVDKILLADGTRTQIKTGQAATEGRDGLYFYLLPDVDTPDLTLYGLAYCFKTADTSVSQRDLAGIYVDYALAHATQLNHLDANITSRATTSDIWDGFVEGTLTFKQAFRLMMSVLFGKSSGGGTANIKFRDMADSKDRISATVDISGNRTSVTKDGT